MTMKDALIWKVMCAAERQVRSGSPVELSIEWPVADEVNEHIHLCVEAGYIHVDKGSGPQFGGGETWYVERLTACGHNKVRSLRGQEPL